MDRKLEHLKIVLEKPCRTEESAGFDYFRFDHNPLTELSLHDIDLSTHFLGVKFNYPLMISSMTGGGGDKTLELNSKLAQLAKDYGLGLGLGSMRTVLEEDQTQMKSFSIARKVGGSIFLAADIGAQQLVGKSLESIRKMIDLIEANALIVHLNPLQELIQPEGDRSFKGIIQAIQNLEKLNLPIILKETGCGFGKKSLRIIQEHLPFVTLDIAGLGGTHWGRVEQYRSPQYSVSYELGNRFKNWGIPTVQSLIMAREILGPQKLIASGGIQHGQEIIKSLCLGASMTAIAGPILFAIQDNNANGWMDTLIHEMKYCLLLLGKQNLNQLNQDDLIKVFPE